MMGNRPTPTRASTLGAYERKIAEITAPATARQEKCSDAPPDVLEACAALDDPVDAVRVAAVLPVPALAPVVVVAAAVPLALGVETTAATEGSPVYIAALENVWQLLDAGMRAEYPMLVIGPSDSAGCVYVRVTPASTYTPGKSWLSPSHDSKTWSRAAFGAL